MNEKFEKLSEEMMKVIESDENLYPGSEVFVEWMEDFEQELFKTVRKSVKKFPEKSGFVEAVTLSIGRFVCTFLEKLQRGGMVTEGTDIYECFKDVLLPVCHKMVKREFEERAAFIIFKALEDESMTEEEIYDMYIADSEDKEEYIQTLKTMREKIREAKE